MAEKKTSMKRFQVRATGTYQAGIEVSAASLEDALAQAADMDFIDFKDDCFDEAHTLTGVFKIE